MAHHHSAGRQAGDAWRDAQPDPVEHLQSSDRQHAGSGLLIGQAGGLSSRGRSHHEKSQADRPAKPDCDASAGSRTNTVSAGADTDADGDASAWTVGLNTPAKSRRTK